MDPKIPLLPQYQPMGVELKPPPDADANPVSCITELAYICHTHDQAYESTTRIRVSGQGEQEHGLNASREASVPAIGR